MNARRVAVGLSGGVDSAFAAHLLKSAGHDVVGVFMRNWDPLDAEHRKCALETDLEDARAVARSLDLDDFVEVDFVREYWTEVFEPFLHSFTIGRTGNPDLDCNAKIKFGLFREFCFGELNVDLVATGHYARLNNNELMRGVDPTKDQSYFLAAAENFENCVFPLGAWKKKNVFETIRDSNFLKRTLHTQLKRKESTGLCFVSPTERKFGDFLSNYLDNPIGNFYDTKGNLLAKHEGVLHYTIGQRARIAGLPEAVFVSERKGKSDLIVAPKHMLYESTVDVETKTETKDLPKLVRAQLRYRDPSAECEVRILSSNKIRLLYDQPQYAPTPGQAAVLYDAETNTKVLCAGEICT